MSLKNPLNGKTLRYIDPNGNYGIISSLKDSGLKEIIKSTSYNKNMVENIISTKPDIIICEYELSDNKNAYDLLEELKAKKMSLLTVFIVLAGENTRERVLSVLELGPDGYILKENSPQYIEDRIKSCVEDKSELKHIYNSIDTGNLEKALQYCDIYINTSNKRFKHRVRKINGLILLQLEKYELAAKSYKDIIELEMIEAQKRKDLFPKYISYAEHGYAMSLYHIGEKEEAINILKRLIEENPDFMGAYATLSDIYIENNDMKNAQEVLQKATSISSFRFDRQKQLGLLAKANGDYKVAETAFLEILNKGRFSSASHPEILIHLVESGINLNKSNDVIQQYTKRLNDFKQTHPTETALCNALIKQKNPNNNSPIEEITALFNALNPEQLKVMSDEIKVDIASTFISGGNMKDGNKLLETTLSNPISIKKAILLTKNNPQIAEIILKKDLDNELQNIKNILKTGNLVKSNEKIYDLLGKNPNNLYFLEEIINIYFGYIDILKTQKDLIFETKKFLDIYFNKIDEQYPNFNNFKNKKQILDKIEELITSRENFQLDENNVELIIRYIAKIFVYISKIFNKDLFIKVSELLEKLEIIDVNNKLLPGLIKKKKDIEKLNLPLDKKEIEPKTEVKLNLENLLEEFNSSIGLYDKEFENLLYGNLVIPNINFMELKKFKSLFLNSSLNDTKIIKPNKKDENTISNNGDIILEEKIILNKQYISNNGNILIKGSFNMSIAEALKGNININYAERSIIIANKVIMEEAVNCIIIADEIVISKSRGTKIFGKNINIKQLDLVGNADMKIILHVYDNIVARKIIRQLNKLQILLKKSIIEVIETYKILMTLGFNNLKINILEKNKNGIIANEKEEELIKYYKIYIDAIKRKTQYGNTLRDLIKKYPKIEEKTLIEMEENNKKVLLKIEQINFPEINISDFLNINFYSDIYVGNILELKEDEKDDYISMIYEILLGNVVNSARIHKYKSSYLKKLDISFPDMKKYLSENIKPIKHIEKNDLDDKIPRSLRIKIHNEDLIYDIRKNIQKLDGKYIVKLDGLHIGFIKDFGVDGIGLILDINQEYTPIFEINDEVELQFIINGILYTQKIIITSVKETTDGILFLGGYNVYFSDIQQDNMYLARNFLESSLIG